MSLATIRSWLGLTSKADASSKSVGALLIKPVSSKNFKSVLETALSPLSDPNKTATVNGFGQKLGILQQHGLEVAISFDKSVLKHPPKAEPKAGVNVFPNSVSSTNQLSLKSVQEKTVAKPIHTVSTISFSSIKKGLTGSIVASDSKRNHVNTSKVGSVNAKHTIDEKSHGAQPKGQKKILTSTKSEKSIRSLINGSAFSNKQDESKTESSIFSHKRVDESAIDDKTKVTAKKVKGNTSATHDFLQQAQIAESDQKILNKPVIKSLDAYSFDALDADETDMETNSFVSKPDSKTSHIGQNGSISSPLNVGNTVSQKSGLTQHQEIKSIARESVAVGNEPEYSVKKVNTKAISSAKVVVKSELPKSTVNGAKETISNTVSSTISENNHPKAELSTKELGSSKPFNVQVESKTASTPKDVAQKSESNLKATSSVKTESTAAETKSVNAGPKVESFSAKVETSAKPEIKVAVSSETKTTKAEPSADKSNVSEKGHVSSKAIHSKEVSPEKVVVKSELPKSTVNGAKETISNTVSSTISENNHPKAELNTKELGSSKPFNVQVESKTASTPKDVAQKSESNLKATSSVKTESTAAETKSVNAGPKVESFSAKVETSAKPEIKVAVSSETKTTKAEPSADKSNVSEKAGVSPNLSVKQELTEAKTILKPSKIVSNEQSKETTSLKSIKQGQSEGASPVQEAKSVKPEISPKADISKVTTDLKTENVGIEKIKSEEKQTVQKADSTTSKPQILTKKDSLESKEVILNKDVSLELSTTLVDDVQTNHDDTQTESIKSVETKLKTEVKNPNKVSKELIVEKAEIDLKESGQINSPETEIVAAVSSVLNHVQDKSIEAPKLSVDHSIAKPVNVQTNAIKQSVEDLPKVVFSHKLSVSDEKEVESKPSHIKNNRYFGRSVQNDSIVDSKKDVQAQVRLFNTDIKVPVTELDSNARANQFATVEGQTIENEVGELFSGKSKNSDLQTGGNNSSKNSKVADTDKKSFTLKTDKQEIVSSGVDSSKYSADSGAKNTVSENTEMINTSDQLSDNVLDSNSLQAKGNEVNNTTEQVFLSSPVRKDFPIKVAQFIRNIPQNELNKDAKFWHKHRLVTDEGEALTIAVRKSVEGTIQLQINGGTPELTRVIQQHLNEIRDNIQQRLELKVEIQFNNPDRDGGSKQNSGSPQSEGKIELGKLTGLNEAGES